MRCGLRMLDAEDHRARPRRDSGGCAGCRAVVSRNRPPDLTGFCRQPPVSPSRGKSADTKHETDRPKEAANTTMQREEITLWPGIVVAEGWHGIETAADNGRSFRWTSTRSCLIIDLGEGAIAEGVNLTFYLGSPAARGEREIAIIGPEGTVRKAVRGAWHYYAVAVHEILGRPHGPQNVVSIEVSEPVHAPGDSRDLGVMVAEVNFGGGEDSFPPVAKFEAARTTGAQSGYLPVSHGCDRGASPRARASP